MSNLFPNTSLPAVVSLPSDEHEAPPLVEQLRQIAIDKFVEDGIRAQLRTPHYLKTLDTVFCGAIWGVPHVLVYSPLLEGESKLSDDDWIAQQMLNILQADYLKLRRKTDPESQNILTYTTICDVWDPPDFTLTQLEYTHWRTQYEKAMLKQHLPPSTKDHIKKKM